MSMRVQLNISIWGSMLGSARRRRHKTRGCLSAVAHVQTGVALTHGREGESCDHAPGGGPSKAAWCRTGYHDDALYPVLEPAIRPLVALLADEEDKTRSNAAGALGNLVRNSNLLCGAMLRAGALEVTALLAASCQPCPR